jgi:phospholipase C
LAETAKFSALTATRQSLPGPTWPNPFFVYSGTSLGHVDMPEGVFNPEIHLYDQRSLYDELDDADVDWRICHGTSHISC